MTSEFCPHCHTLRNMTSSISKKKGKDRKEIILISYSCEHCGSFIRSEERDQTNLTRTKKLEDLLTK